MDTKEDIPTVEVMIEITKGSRNKYEYDPGRKAIRFDRMLFLVVAVIRKARKKFENTNTNSQSRFI